MTRPSTAYGDGGSLENANPADTLIRQSTEQQQQLYALRMAVDQLAMNSTDLSSSQSKGLTFPTVGTLIRSIPTEVVLNKFDTDLTQASSNRWMERNLHGRVIHAEFVIEGIDLDKQKNEIVLKAQPITEPFASTEVTANLVCRFAAQELDRMTHLREGMRIRIRGVVDLAFFTQSQTANNNVLKLDINHARMVEEPGEPSGLR